MQRRVLVMFDWWWSHQLNYSGAADVLGRKMSLISNAVFGLKCHSLDKTIYLGHGSFAGASSQLPEHLLACKAIISPPQLCLILQNIPSTLQCQEPRLLIEAASTEMSFMTVNMSKKLSSWKWFAVNTENDDHKKTTSKVFDSLMHHKVFQYDFPFQKCQKKKTTVNCVSLLSKIWTT